MQLLQDGVIALLAAIGLTALLCLAVGLCGALHLREAELRREIAALRKKVDDLHRRSLTSEA